MLIESEWWTLPASCNSIITISYGMYNEIFSAYGQGYLVFLTHIEELDAVIRLGNPIKPGEKEHKNIVD